MDSIIFFIPLAVFLALVVFGIVLKIVLPSGTKLELSKGALVLLLTVGIYNAIAMTVLIILLITASSVFP